MVGSFEFLCTQLKEYSLSKYYAQTCRNKYCMFRVFLRIYSRNVNILKFLVNE